MTSHSAEYYKNRGNSHFEMRDFVSAISDYSRAIELDGKYNLAYYNRGVARFALGDLASAIADFEMVIEQDENFTDAYLYRGIVLYELGNPEASITDFGKVIELDDKYTEAYYNRGVVKNRLGDFVSAISDYNITIELDDKHTKAYYNRGLVKARLCDLSSAINDYNRVIELDDKFTLVHYNRGVANAELGDFVSAINDFGKAIELNEQDALAYYNRGVAKAGINDFVSAINDYNRAIELDDKFVKAYFNRGVVKTSLGDIKDAIDDFGIAIGLDDKHTKAYYNRGGNKVILDDFVSAIDDYNIAIGINEEFVEAYYNRGVVKFNLGYFESAINDFGKVIELDEIHASAYFNRGYVNSVINNNDQAKANYVRTVFLDKYGNDQVYILLSFFRDKVNVPFIVKRLINNYGFIHQVHGYKRFFLRIDDQCKHVQNFLDYLLMDGWGKQHKLKFKHLSALCQYFMGDTAEAFRIFEEEIDDVDRDLSLMSHYYYIQSAISSAVPESSVVEIRKDALQAAEAVINTELPVDLIQYYYAGLIIYHFGENEALAIICFQKAKGLLPALYMEWLLKKPEEQKVIKQEIIKRESSLPVNKAFGQGLTPNSVGRTFSKSWGALQHYCFYQEILVAIRGVHTGQVQPVVSEFFDYWWFEVSPEEQVGLGNFRKSRLAEEILSGMDDTLVKMKKKIDHQALETSLKRSIKSIVREFEALQHDADNRSSLDLEYRLASHIYESAILEDYEKLHIAGFDFLETHQKLATYFFLVDKISTRTTVNLLLYAIFTANRFNPKLFPVLTRDSLIDGTADAVKGSDAVKEIGIQLAHLMSVTFATTWGTPLSVFLISSSMKALVMLLNETRQEPKHRIAAADDYEKFISELTDKLAAVKDADEQMPDLGSMLK